MKKASTFFKKLFWGFLALTVLLWGCAFARQAWNDERLRSPDAPASTPLEDLNTQTEETTDETTPITDSGELPNALNIELPFYSQAPTGNWDYPWQDACEEASVALIANVYLDKNWSREEFNEQLLALVDWQGQNGIDYHDTTLAETAEIMTANYGLEGVIHDNPSFEDIQEILNEGHLIIAGFAGKMLGNPNFTNGGPVYHMLVIKGYDNAKSQIVTHDVGTRNGADYVYSWSVIDAALHDWNPDNILDGTPRILEVLPPTL